MTYRKNCLVCQFMKKNPVFRAEIMSSSYFDPEAKESAAEVVHRWDDPMKMPTLYQHFKRHQADDLVRTPVRYKNGKMVVDKRFKDTVEVLAVDPSEAKNHEVALGEFIQRGRDMLAAGTLRVSASTFVQAIRTQAEIDAKNKDRKVDLLKTIFTGASGHKNDEDPDPEE